VRSIRGERPIDVRLQLGQVDLDQLIVLCALVRLQALLHGPHNHNEIMNTLCNYIAQRIPLWSSRLMHDRPRTCA